MNGNNNYDKGNKLLLIKVLLLFTDDITRVILVGGSGGDYINANYVNMEIPGSGIINRYIATQG